MIEYTKAVNGLSTSTQSVFTIDEQSSYIRGIVSVCTACNDVTEMFGFLSGTVVNNNCDITTFTKL